MIPSRALKWSAQNIGVGRRRIELLSIRSFSSPACHDSSKPKFLASRSGASGRTTFSRSQIPRSTYILQNAATIRFQSTSTVVTGAKDTIDASAWAQDYTGVGSLNNAIELASSNLQNVPEQIGYLKAIGLDYGHGPTGMMEWILEHVHVLAGTPWWASIALTALIVRLVCLYPNFMGTDNAAKMAIVAPLAKPLMEKMKDSSRLGDTAETMRIRAEIQLLNKRAGVKYWKALVPFIQAPVGFGTFFLLRGMANLPVAGLETGGTLWFSNLVLPDPLFILPIATAGILHLVLRKGGETGVQSASPEFLRIVAYLLPAISVIFTSFMPAAIQLSFFMTGFLSYCQAMLFRWAPFRAYMDMTPLPTGRPDVFASTRAPAAEPSPYQSRIITATPRLTSSATSANYEPPRSTTPDNTPEGKATLFSGLKREVSSGISSVQEAARKTVKSAREITGQDSKDGKRTKKQLQRANEYEKKRRLEESRKRDELERERKARREVR